MSMDTERPALSPGQRWKDELAQAKQHLRPWHESGRAILKRLKVQRGAQEEGRRASLFTANYLLARAILYGKTPQSTVARRWKDAEDDEARVAGEMLRRLLNDDIATGADKYARALGYVIDDRLSVGMGLARVRYEVEMEPSDAMAEEPVARVDADATPLGDASMADTPRVPVGPSTEPLDTPLVAAERKRRESVAVDYVFWEDVLWSPCRYWEVARWVAFKAEMSRKALVKRFGEGKGGGVPLDVGSPKESGKENQPEPPWGRATVWEVWDKEEREVVWVTEGGVVLDTRKDPYRLRDFFPCPRPLFALTTTDEMIPRPDYSLAEDLYQDLDDLAERMHLLRTSLRVVGMYDASNQELAELLTNTGENRMVPVKNWALFGEKGGLAGAVDFFPVQEVVSALVSLGGEYEALKNRLYELTGFGDILRGQGSAIQTTATEQRVKAQFGSARLQSVQDEFARFATDLQNLKRELLGELFDTETLIRDSNILRTPDAALAEAAAELLKNDAEAFRVQVQPESLALSDFAAVKEERLEVVAAVGQFVSAITPLLQLMPQSLPSLVEVLKWLVASLRGSSEIEGVLDRAIAMAQQAAAQPKPEQPPQPDPKLVAQQMKGQQELAKIQAESQARRGEIQAEVMADEIREQNQMRYNVQEHAAKQQISNATRAMQPGGPL